MSQNTIVILAVLIVYKIVLIGVGLWAQRRSRSAQEFLIGDRQLGPVVAAVSYAASSSSAWTLLGMSGIAFTLGVSAIWFVFGSILGMVISWTFLAPKLMQFSHKHKLITLTDILVLGVKGPWRKPIIYGASITIIACFSFYVAAQLQGAGQTFNHAFGMPQQSSIIIGAIIILIYTLLGGFWAVSVTDTIQGILMLIAALLLPITAYVQLGGFGGFWEAYSELATPSQQDFFNNRVGIGAFGFVVGILGITFGTFGQPHLLVRFMALRSPRALIQARLIAISWFAIVFGGMFFLGLAGRVLVASIDNPESIFIALTEQLFSPVIAGIIIAALFSAIMSTADSQLLSGSAAISHDLGLAHYFKGREVLISRLAITFILIISCVIALNIPATIFSRALLSWSALGAAFGPIVIAQVLSLKASPRALFFAMATGFSSAVWFHFYPQSLSWLIDTQIIAGSVHERVTSFFLGVLILLVSHRCNK